MKLANLISTPNRRYSSSLPVSMEMSRHLNSPAHTMASTTASTPTHTSLTEGTPSYTASSPSCSSEFESSGDSLKE